MVNWSTASRGIGTGLGIIGVGIGLRFMKDITDDFKTRHKQSRPPRMLFEPIKIKKHRWR